MACLLFFVHLVIVYLQETNHLLGSVLGLLSQRESLYYHRNKLDFSRRQKEHDQGL